MTAQPDRGTTPRGEDAGLDATLDYWIRRFKQSRRVDGAAEAFRAVIARRLADAGLEPGEARLLELNLSGSLSSWMEYSLTERAQGRNVVPDFARHLRNAFLVHCRQHRIDPEVGVAMALELATAIMDLACGFRRHMGLAAEPPSPDGDAAP